MPLCRYCQAEIEEGNGSLCADCISVVKEGSKSAFEEGQEWTGEAIKREFTSQVIPFLIGLPVSFLAILVIAPEYTLDRLSLYTMLLYFVTLVPTGFLLSFLQLNRESEHYSMPSRRSHNPLARISQRLAQSERGGAYFMVGIAALMLLLLFGLSGAELLVKDFPSAFSWLEPGLESVEESR